MPTPATATPRSVVDRPQSSALAAPLLRPWSRIWRYLVAVATGLLLWIFVVNDHLGVNPDDLSDADAALISILVLLDLLLGMVALCLLPLRRRRPVLVAFLITCFSALSASAIGSAIIAIVSLSTGRRWKPVAAVGVVWVAVTMFYELVLRQTVPTTTIEFPASWISGGLVLAIYAVCVTTGFYIGARRELLASLRDRVENAEREQALREVSAREAERTLIAREMHDVLAHHISLISLHAGALSYRTDLQQDEAVEAATVIQSNAQLALTELRQILGVLRSPEGGTGVDGDRERRVERPQPTLRQLPALIADAREAGMRVTLHTGEQLSGLSESMSRTAYRIIQEALTNARKHAPGEAVTVLLHQKNNEVFLEIENRRMTAIRAPVSNPVTDDSGVGLTGLHERAELAGGTFAHEITPDGRFVVRARLPWV